MHHTPLRLPTHVSERLAGVRAIVTGGAGFIGSHVVDGLIQAGAERVLVADDLSLGRRDNLDAALASGVAELAVIDCADQRAFEDAVGDERYDICFNLSVIPLPHSLVDPRANVDRNVAMTSAVCELGRAGRSARLVHVSSSEVYGTAQSVPMREDHPLLAHTPYAAAKAATDLVVNSYATTFGMDVTTVRPFNTYGERQNDAAYAGLIPAVVARVRQGLPVIIHGDGLQTRDMTHVSDSVRGILAVAASDEARNRTLNLGTGTEASVLDMVRLLLDALGVPDHPIRHDAPRPGDVRRLLADITAARETVGYAPTVPLADGLRRTAAWYQATRGDAAASPR